MDKNKGEIAEFGIADLNKLKTEIFKDFGERKYKIISITPRREKDIVLSTKGSNYYNEYYLVYVKLGSTLKEVEEKRIAKKNKKEDKKNKKEELLSLINSIYEFVIPEDICSFVLPEEKKNEIVSLKEKESKAQKLKEAEEFRRRNNPTIEERKEKLQKAKDYAREVTESSRYLRPHKR